MRWIFAVLAVLMFGCASLLPFQRTSLAPVPPTTTEFERQLVECMTNQIASDADVFPPEDWNLSAETEVDRLMKGAQRFDFKRATQCIVVFDRHLASILKHEPLTAIYTADDVKAKRTATMAMYHKLMQSLIETEQPIETSGLRWSRAKLVLDYTEQLAALQIPPAEVNLQPRDLVRAYQRGIQEDLAAVKAKRVSAADLCRLITMTDKVPPHNLPKQEVQRLQCAPTNMAATAPNQ